MCVYVCVLVYVCVHVKSPQSCLTLCDIMGCSPPGTSVHGILQAKILEWIAMSSSGNLPDPGIELALLCLLYCQVLYCQGHRESLCWCILYLKRWVLLWKGSKEFGVKSKFGFQPCHLLAVFSLVITYFY